MASCACIKGNYLFSTEAIDSNNLLYTDLSDWMEGENYASPGPYSIMVIPPGKISPVTIQVDAQTTTKITNADLGGCLVDGIYCFETFSCGVNYKRFVGIFPKLYCCIKKARATLPEKLLDKLDEVDREFKSLLVNIELQNSETAKRNYRIITKLLENLNCDCDSCGC